MHRTAVAIGHVNVGQKGREPWHPMPTPINAHLGLVPLDPLDTASHPGATGVGIEPGASVGAMVSFTLSRYVARPWVEKMFVRHGGRFKALDDAVSNDGSQIVILVRLSPFSPFTVASYMLGLTSVPFVSYAAATLVGLLPSSFVYVYIGDTGRRASGSEGATAIEIVFYVLGLLMTLFVSYRIAVIAQDAMRAKVGLDWDPSTDSDEEVELDVFGSRIDEEVEGAPLEDDGDDRDKPNTIL